MLIIDDNSDQWTIIQTALKEVLPHVKAFWATGVDSAINYLNECINNYENLPSLILLDLYLPKREIGLELIQQLKRKDSMYAHLPVVVLSYSDDRTDIQAMYQTGCASYLVKPTSLEGWRELVEMIKIYWWETATKPDQVVRRWAY